MTWIDDEREALQRRSIEAERQADNQNRDDVMYNFCDFCGEELGSTGFLVPIGFTFLPDSVVRVPEVRVWCGQTGCEVNVEIDSDAHELIMKAFPNVIQQCSWNAGGDPASQCDRFAVKDGLCGEHSAIYESLVGAHGQHLQLPLMAVPEG